MHHRHDTPYVNAVRLLGTGLISTGMGLLLFVAITVAWGDPFTMLGERDAQQDLGRQLERQFASATIESGELRESNGLDPRLTRKAATRAQRGTAGGQVAGRIKIPRMELRKYIVGGTTPAALEKGPGLYPETGFPGNGGPVAIAGHRTTYGAPFLDVDKLRRGDPIVIDMPYGRFTYLVSDTRIITPTDWSIIEYGAAEPSKRSRARIARQVAQTTRCPIATCEHLVLTACHPKYSAAQRIAVFARLSSVELRGGGGGGGGRQQ